MKLEEVKALSNKELRIKAAELVGWIDIHLHPKANLLVGYRAEHTEQQRKVWGLQPIPDYPNDIAAAWPLWLKMTAKEPYKFALYSNLHGQVELEHYPDDYIGDRGRGNGDWSFEGVAEIVITRAFVLAMESDAK